MERHFEVVYDNVFQPWGAARVRNIADLYVAAQREGKLSSIRQSDEMQDFEKHHPVLAGKLCDASVTSDPHKLALIYSIITMKERQEQGHVTPSEAANEVTGQVLRFFKTEA